MLWHDISGQRQGLLEDMEDTCGLGPTGISSNAVLYQQFVRWANQWQKKVIRIILSAQDGDDYDDPNYTTYPSGTMAGTTNRDYQFDPTLKLLKIKNVGASYDGVNFIKLKPIDTTDPDFVNVKADPNIDRIFSQVFPRYDATAGGIDLYPKFTQDQVNLGAKVYVEFWRDAAIEFATTGTDSIAPGFDVSLHPIISQGASYQYAKLYKPDLMAQLERDIFGFKTRYGVVNPGIIDDIVDFYSFRVPQAKRIRPAYKNPR